MAELRRTLYSNELQKLLFPDNSFYKKSIGEAGVADDVVKVEKPVQNPISNAVAGALPSLPLEVETSVDSTKYYETVLIYCKPLLVDSQSQLLTNYNKRQTKQEQQANELNTAAAGYALSKWLPTSSDNILKTTGTARASNVSGFSSNRKAVTKEDFLRVYNTMLRMNVGSVGGSWYGLLTPDMYTDLLAIPDFVDYYKIGNESKLKEGILGRICGIDVMVRSVDYGHNGILYDNSKTPVTAAGMIVEDSFMTGALFWNDRMVCRAEGRVNVAINENAPGYLGGTILETWCRFGADIIRKDQKGVIVLLEDKAS